MSSHPTYLEIHFNNILLSMPKYANKFPSLRSPHQNPVCTSPVSYTCYMPRPSHSSWFYSSNNIWWGAQSMKLIVKIVFSNRCLLVPLKPKCLPQHPILEHPQPMNGIWVWALPGLRHLGLKTGPLCYASPWIRETKFHTHTK